MDTSEKTIETPKTKKRNETTGMYDDVTYHYNPDGYVNWRKMIKPEFLVANPERTKETDVSLLKDGEILILLGGIKELAQLRGFSQVNYTVNACSVDYCCVTCTICWIANEETDGRHIMFSSIADAHAKNTDEKMGLNYLASIAENRAFVRCVRNFLRINIVGKDELKGGFKQSSETEESQEDQSTPSPKKIFLKLLEEKKVTFETVKNKLIEKGMKEAENFENVDDIPSSKLFELIVALKKKS